MHHCSTCRWPTSFGMQEVDRMGAAASREQVRQDEASYFTFYLVWNCSRDATTRTLLSTPEALLTTTEADGFSGEDSRHSRAM